MAKNDIQQMAKTKTKAKTKQTQQIPTMVVKRVGTYIIIAKLEKETVKLLEKVRAMVSAGTVENGGTRVESVLCC